MAVLSLVAGSEFVDLAASQTTGRSVERLCWSKAHDTVNRDLVGKAAPRLPPELAREKVKRTAVVLRMCIDDSGKMTEAWFTTSSGNQKVDDFFRAAVLKWKLKPAIVDGIASLDFHGREFA